MARYRCNAPNPLSTTVVQTERLLSIDLEDRSLVYDRCVEKSGQLGASHEWLISRVPVGAEVLDVGCAGGYLARALIRERRCTVDGIEIDAAAVGRAATLCRRVFVGSLEDEDFLSTLDGPYDRIVLGDVLEHLREPEHVLAALTRLLAPGGRLLVSLPNIAHWSVRWELLRGRFAYTETGLLDRTHLRFYTFETADDLFVGAGLQVVDKSYTRRYPRFLAGQVVVRLLTPLFPNLFAYQSLFELQAEKR
jgi:methionine biosynthesis protein MetW